MTLRVAHLATFQMLHWSGFQHSPPTRAGSTPLSAVSTPHARRHSSAPTSDASLQ
jgi:hypothetical protein